jgi:hypothetical protein
VPEVPLLGEVPYVLGEPGAGVVFVVGDVP